MTHDVADEIHVEEHEEIVAQHQVPPKPIARIPSIDQFPRIAQQQVAAQQNRIATIAEQAQKKRKGIFERLADVGLGRRTDAVAVHAPSVPAPRRAEHKMQPQAEPVQIEQPAPQMDAGYDDDQLAIPAFLRRQANG